jgi:hypothetical protein
MAELGWSASEVMQDHLQNLMSQGYMTASEHATCHVPEDPASHVYTGEYVMACAAFYEWCAITLISLLFATALQPETASLNPLGDLVHGGFGHEHLILRSIITYYIYVCIYIYEKHNCFRYLQ